MAAKYRVEGTADIVGRMRREALVRLLRRPRITAEMAEALGVKRIEVIAQLRVLEEMGIVYRAEVIGKDQIWELRARAE